ncbi:hypothetical protein N7537_007490 [Penicillium hordei]|uniref:Uncharacterized protein n=1 Tax=Penicillium hordei TaxID=40994 RepID=A0AAD6DZU9_9EURO|nr:uncharacterized protein N7537_007490 [Penicillium hordei]KAJ5597406.1 hypothetical protein N7537_007490 [Penicillium hordei]
MCQLQRMAATLCYGYYFAKDERIPDIHYCYSCLIGHEFDSDLMKQVVKLIRTRRTIYLVIITGATPTLNWQLVGQLNCTDDEARAASMAKRWNITIKLGNTKFCLNQTIPACNTKPPVTDSFTLFPVWCTHIQYSANIIPSTLAGNLNFESGCALTLLPMDISSRGRPQAACRRGCWIRRMKRGLQVLFLPGRPRR